MREGQQRRWARIRGESESAATSGTPELEAETQTECRWKGRNRRCSEEAMAGKEGRSEDDSRRCEKGRSDEIGGEKSLSDVSASS
jgi:hypothetical protein